MVVAEERLKEAIIKKFGTQAKFAKAIGSTPVKVSRGIKTQSSRFILKLREAGIDPDDLIIEEEYKNQAKLSTKLMAAEKRIKELEKLVEDQYQVIESFKMILKRIKE